MATLNATVTSLLDHAKRMDPDGKIAPIVELLSQRNKIIADIPFKEGNLPTGHQFTVRTGLPALTWRKFNEGIDPSKSHTDQFTETCGMLAGLCKVDVELAKLNGNEAAFRMSEEASFVSALANEVEGGMFYHSTKATPEKFMGLAPRYDSTTGLTGSQIILADASPVGSDQTSILLVKWDTGGGGAYGIFPKGSTAGFERTDMGKQLTTETGTKQYLAWVTQYMWKLGLVVEDFRSVVRVANVDNSQLVATGSVIQTAMIKAYNQMYQPGQGNCVWYMNRKVATFLHLQAVNGTSNSTLSIKNYGGESVVEFLGHPIRVTDGLLNTEAIVT